jgi:hypothetical protein
MAGLRNNFQDHRRLSEIFLELQGPIRKPEQAGYWKDFNNYSKCFHRSKQKLHFEFLYKKEAKNCENCSALIQKVFRV